MLTYQDFTAAPSREAFLASAVQEHTAGAAYRTAAEADAYDRQQNVTITRYRRLLYTLSGQAVPDNYAANHKVASGFFGRLVRQECQYLLGNGVLLGEAAEKAALGSDFDVRLQALTRAAIAHGVSFGFWNADHLEVFRLTEFVPLYDEETGDLRAGIRFWQLSPEKPQRLTLYEADGYTEYRAVGGRLPEEVWAKRPYREVVRRYGGAETVIGGENYGALALPVVPLYGNPQRQSALVGMKAAIDSYDLIKSGFANDLDDASMIYWTLENCGGMDELDLARFVERLRTVRAAVVDGDAGARAEAHTVEVPHEARLAYLDRLERDLYADFGGLDVRRLSAGARTATEIAAAYQPLDEKCDQLEYCVLEFLGLLFPLAGLPGARAQFRRDRVVNREEETRCVLLAADHLDEETLLRHLTFLEPDEIPDILARKSAEK